MILGRVAQGLPTKAGTRAWVITAAPHVALRLKRVFAKLGEAAREEYTLSDTPENARELQWFLARFPLIIGDGALKYLERRAKQHKDQETLVSKMLGGRKKLQRFDLATPAREYQMQAAALALASGGLLLADDMGNGKSCSAICMLVEPNALPAVVVTKTELPQQWRRELRKFLPQLRAHVIQSTQPYNLNAGCRGLHEYASDWLGGQRCSWCGSTPEEVRARAFATPDVIITSYSKIPRWAETLAALGLGAVIYDEGQELRRQSAGKKDEQTAKYASCELLANAARYRMICTATPVYNYGSEIYNVVNIARPGTLGTVDEFKTEWCEGSYGADGQACIKDPKAFGLYMRESGIMLRRTRSDIGRELPALTNITQTVEADIGALSRVDNQCAELARFILGQGPRPGSVAADPEANVKGAHMLASQQLSNQLRQATGIAKAPAVADFVRLLVESEGKVVLFGWHRAVYSIWLDQLKDLLPLLYTGSESAKAKDDARSAFVEGDCKLLIMSLRSGAGLDGLQQVCRTPVFGELDWSPWVMAQCAGRFHRDGQAWPVFAYYMMADVGADPIIADVLGIKDEQGRGIRDPDLDLVERADPDANIAHVKRLAEAYLAQRTAPPARRTG